MRKLRLLYVLFMVLEYIPDVILENVESLGCWKDSQRKRALQSLENSHIFLAGDYRKRVDPIKRCAQVANDHGYLVFAIQNGGECLSGPGAERRFSMYGPSQNCRDGKGGLWSSNVYTYLPADPRTRANVLGTRRAKVFAAIMNKMKMNNMKMNNMKMNRMKMNRMRMNRLPRRQQLWFAAHRPYRRPIISPQQVIRTNASMIGTQRNKLLFNLNKSLRRQISRVPHQALHGPIKSRHRIQVLRAPHQALHGPVKSRIWTQVPRGAHPPLRGLIKSRIWTPVPRRAHQALRGPIKSTFRTQVSRDPHKALGGPFKLARRTKVNVLGTRRNRVMTIMNKFPRRLMPRVPHQLLRNPIMLARRFRTNMNVLGTRRNRVMPMMNKYPHRLAPHVPRQLFARNPMLARRFRTKASVVGTRRNRVQSIVNSFPHRTLFHNSHQSWRTPLIPARRSRPGEAPGFSRSLHSSMDPTPWDPYCSRDLDIVILMDGSGATSRRNRARWDEMKEFVSAFSKGFDDHSHLGVIAFGEDSEIICDVHKSYKAEDIEEKLKNIDMPGGKRGLNEALKTAWREQLKQSNRTSADKIIIALTTGDLASGLYGSTQFLTEHNIRVIAVGIDKDPHYEFLQSIASYRDVSNVFSVNSENLLDAAPYMYRDVCNNVQLESAKSNKRTVYRVLPGEDLKTISARTNHALGMALGIARNTKRFPGNTFGSRPVSFSKHGAQYNPNLRPHSAFASPATHYSVRGDTYAKMFPNKILRQGYWSHIPTGRGYQRVVTGNSMQAVRNHMNNVYNLHRRVVPIRKYIMNVNRLRRPFMNSTGGIDLARNDFPHPNMVNIRHFPALANRIHNVNRNLLVHQRGNLRLSHATRVRPPVPANRFHQDHVKNYRSQGNSNLHNVRYTTHANNGRQTANSVNTGTFGSINVPERKHISRAKVTILVPARKNKKDAVNAKATASSKTEDLKKPPGVQVVPDNEDIVIAGKNVKAVPNEMNNKAIPLRRADLKGAPTNDGMKKVSAGGVKVIPDDDDIVITGKAVKTAPNPTHNDEVIVSKQNGKNTTHLRRNKVRPVEVNVIHTGKDTNYHLRLSNLKKSDSPLVDEDIQEQEEVTRQGTPNDIAKKESNNKGTPNDIAKKESNNKGAPNDVAKKESNTKGTQYQKPVPAGEPSPMGQEILKTAAQPVLINEEELNSFLGGDIYDNNDKRTLHHRGRKINVTASRRSMKVANTSLTTSLPEYVSETTRPPTLSTTGSTATTAPTTAPYAATTAAAATTKGTPVNTTTKKTADVKSAGNSSTRDNVPTENTPSNADGKKLEDVISSFNGLTSDLASEPTVLLNPSPEAPQKDKAGNIVDKPTAQEDNSTDISKSASDTKDDDDDEDKFYEKQAQRVIHHARIKTHNVTKDDDDDDNIRTFHDANNSRSLEHSDHHVPTEEKLSSNDERLYQVHLGLPLSSTDHEDSDKLVAKNPLRQSEEAADPDITNKKIKESKQTVGSDGMINEVEEGEEGQKEPKHATTTNTGVSRSEIYKLSKNEYRPYYQIKATLGTTKDNIVEPLLVSNSTKVESAKEGETTLNGVGALSQTIEYHVGGNSTLHVSNHTHPHGLNIHQSIFSGKLHDRISHFPSLSLFHQPHDVFSSNELNEQQVRSTLQYPQKKINTNSFVKSAGEELENLFTKTHQSPDSDISRHPIAQTIQDIRGDKRTIGHKGVRHEIDESPSAMKIPKNKIDRMVNQFGKYTAFELPDETDTDEVQQVKVDRVLAHFSGNKRNYNDITTFTEVPYYRAVKKMYHSLLNHEGGLSRSLRPEQIRRISVIANQIKSNRVAQDIKFNVPGTKRNESSEDLKMIFNDDYVGDPKSVMFGGTATLGDESLNGEDLYDPEIPEDSDLNFNMNQNLETMRTDMVEEDMPSPMNFLHSSKHIKHKKLKPKSKEGDERDSSHDPITPELIKEQARLTEPQETSYEEEGSTGGAQQKLKGKEDKEDEKQVSEETNTKGAANEKQVSEETNTKGAENEKQVSEETNTKGAAKQNSKAKANQQHDSAHDSITPALIKEQTKLTEPQKPSYEDDDSNVELIKQKAGKEKNPRKGKKSTETIIKELKQLEKEHRATEKTLGIENKTKEDTKKYKEEEIEELGKEYQSNEILLKNDEKNSNDANLLTNEEKKNNGKSDVEIEAENKEILNKILGLIHQIKPLHFGDNVTAGKIEEIAFHNNLNSYFHNAFDNIDATRDKGESSHFSPTLVTQKESDSTIMKNTSTLIPSKLTTESAVLPVEFDLNEEGAPTLHLNLQSKYTGGNKISADHGCPLNSLCMDTDDGQDSVPIIGNASQGVGLLLAPGKEQSQMENQGKTGGTLGAERDVVRGARKEVIEYVDGEAEREQSSNLEQVVPLENFRESASKKNNPIRLPDSPNIPADQPHMSSLKPIGHIHPPLYRPVHHTATPEHPPGFKSLFEHVDRKNSISDDSSIVKGLNENKDEMGDASSSMSHMKAGLTYGTENARKKTLVDTNHQPLIHLPNDKSKTVQGGLHGRTFHAATTKFLPQKKAIFYDEFTPTKRTQTRLNDTLENIYRAINQGNNEVIIHQLESLAKEKKSQKLEAGNKDTLGVNKYVGKEKGENNNIMHQLGKLATQRTLETEYNHALSLGKNNENQNTDSGEMMSQLEKFVTQKMTSKFQLGNNNKITFGKTDQDDNNNDQRMMHQLRKLAMQKKKSKLDTESNDKVMLNKYHVSDNLRKGFVLGNKKHTLERKYVDSVVAPRSPPKPALNKPVNENSVKNNVFDMMDLNDQDLSTLQPTAPSSIQASKKETMQTMENLEHRGGSHEVQYLPTGMKEDAFPRSFPYNSFALSDLPKLPMEKSYVISPPRAGNVMVSIRDNILNDSEQHFVNEGGDLSNDDIMAKANHEINRVDSLSKSIEKLEKQDEKLFVPPEVEKVHDGYKKDLHGFSPSSEPHTLAGLTNEIETRKVTLDEAKEPSILAYNDNAQKRNVTTKGLYEEVFPITQMLNADQAPLPLSSLLPDKDEKLEMAGSEIVSNFRNNIGNRHMYGDTQKFISPWRSIPQLTPRHQIGENSSSSKLVNEISDLLKGSLDVRSNKGDEAGRNDTSPRINVKFTPAQRNESTNTNTSLNNKDTSNLTVVAVGGASEKIPNVNVSGTDSKVEVKVDDASENKVHYESNDTMHENEQVNSGINNETMKYTENKNVNQSSESPTGVEKVNDIKGQTTNDTTVTQGNTAQPNVAQTTAIYNSTESATNGVNGSSANEAPSKSNYTATPGNAAVQNSSISNETYRIEVTKNSYQKHPPKYKSKANQNTLHNKGISVSLSHLQVPSNSETPDKPKTSKHGKVSSKDISTNDDNQASYVVRERTKPKITVIKIINIPNPNKVSEDSSEEIYDTMRRNETTNGEATNGEANAVSNETVSEEQKQDIDHGNANLMDNQTNVTSSVKVVDAQLENQHKGKLSNDEYYIHSPHLGAAMVNDSSLVDYNDVAPQPDNRVGGEPPKENSASAIHTKKGMNESFDGNVANLVSNEDKSENTTAHEMQPQSQNLDHEIKASSLINESSSSQNESLAILPLQDYKNDSYKTNITNFKLLDNKDIQKTKSLLENVDSSGIFGKGVITTQDKETAQYNSSFDDLKKSNDFPFIKPSENNESLKTISSTHDKKDNFELKPFNEIATDVAKEHEATPLNDTFAKHLVDIQKARELPYNLDDRHLDDLKMVRDSPLNEEKPSYPKENKEVEQTNFRSSTTAENNAHMLLQNPSPSNLKIKAEHQDESTVKEQVEPSEEHHETSPEPHLLLQNPSPTNTKPNTEYHQVSGEPPQVSPEYNVATAEHHDILTDHHEPTPEHHQMISEYHEPSPEHHDMISEHHEPTPEHHEIISDHHEATPDHHEMILEHHEPTPEHHEMLSDHHEPTPEHHDMISDHHEPTPEHHDMISDHHEPTPEHHEMISDHHEATPDHHEMILEHHESTPEHHEMLSDHHEPTPDHHEMISEHHEPTRDHHEVSAEEHHQAEHPEVATENHEATLEHHEGTAEHHDTAPEHQTSSQEEPHKDKEAMHSSASEGNSSFVIVSDKAFNKTLKELQNDMPAYNETNVNLLQNNTYQVNGSKEKYPKTFTEFINDLNSTNLIGDEGDNSTAPHGGMGNNESIGFQNGLMSTNLESNSSQNNTTNSTLDISSVTSRQDLLSNDSMHDNNTAEAEMKNKTDCCPSSRECCTPEQATHLTDYSAIFTNKSTGAAPHTSSSKEENGENVEFNNLEFAAGCSMPLRVVYAIDVSEGLGSGLERGKKWNKLNNFINKISKGFASGVTQKFMVYNVEPRFLKELSGCDEDTEYFTLADDCLCDIKSRVDNPNGCSVNAPLHSESIEDWGLQGPRTGLALKRVHDFFRTNRSLTKFKNLVILVSYQDSADDISEAERSLKRDGISLVNIDFGLHTSSLKRRNFINPAPRWGSRHITQNPVFRFKRNRIEDSIPKEHKFKVSFKSFRNSLGKIIKKVCKAEPGKRRSLIGNNIRKSNIASLGAIKTGYVIM